jgi:predicted RNA-binding Zn ribbon-like protein
MEMGEIIPEGVVPKEIKLVNEFLNTLNLVTFGNNASKHDDERDELRTVDGFTAWLRARGLVGGDVVVSESDRELAVRVRNALRDAAEANTPSKASDAWTRRESITVDTVLSELPLVVHLGEDRRPHLTTDLTGARGALARVLADVAVAMAKGTWDRLRICSAEDCRWAYYDHSKSRTGRWCAMETCGNRHKTRRYRERRKARPEES